MKTLTNNLKDNLAYAVLLVAMAVATIGAFTKPASASQPQAITQTMEAVVVTASRVQTMDEIVVTAHRQ